MSVDLSRAAPRPAWHRTGGRLALAVMALLLACAAHPAPRAAQDPDPALEARVHAFTRDLRCLVCQNESLADSRAPLAQDLREEVRELFRSGRNEDQARQFLVSRYGDFVRYDPPLNPSTLLLWLGPGLLLGAALGWLPWRLRRHAQAPVAPLSAQDSAEARALLAGTAAPAPVSITPPSQASGS